MTYELLNREAASIRAFVQSAPWPAGGRVLDYGCGRSPYRDIVEGAGATYVGYDRASFPAGSLAVGSDPWRCRERHGRRYDAILCTQVLQFIPIYGGMVDGGDYEYLETPLADLLSRFAWALGGSRTRSRHPDGGHLILTYPTSWPEVNEGDLTRFTREGMERLVTGSGFTIERHELRATWPFGGYDAALGYGMIARA